MVGSEVYLSKVLSPGAKYNNTPLVWDIGSSFGYTDFRSDFVDYVEADISVKDVTKVNSVIVIGKKNQKCVLQPSGD